MTLLHAELPASAVGLTLWPTQLRIAQNGSRTLTGPCACVDRCRTTIVNSLQAGIVGLPNVGKVRAVFSGGRPVPGWLVSTLMSSKLHTLATSCICR
jgi:hypothetical protein